MTQQIEDTWVKEIFTSDELKDYAKFETELKTNSTPEQKEMFEKNWFHLVEEFKNSLHNDPNSETGIRLGKKLMNWVNNLYGVWGSKLPFYAVAYYANNQPLH